jgi:type I restriction enzyme, S subunit
MPIDINIPFEKAFKDTTRLGTKIPASAYLKEGSIPVVDQGKEFISGYVDDDSVLYEGPLPVIIFGDHTRIIKFIDFRFAMGADGVKVLTPTDLYLPKFLYFYLKAHPIEEAGYSRHFKYLKEMLFPDISIEDQTQVVKVMSQAERVADLCKLALDKSNALVSSMFYEMFNKD